MEKFEPTLLTGSAGGIPPEPPFRPLCPEVETKKQTAKEPEKNIGSNFIKLLKICQEKTKLGKT
ncbi:MAG: hypothetical protein RMJ65_06780 [candidate division WOR-3 bacterium]|nr:hypothetical protein [candidate division WOR-3 bacterium]